MRRPNGFKSRSSVSCVGLCFGFDRAQYVRARDAELMKDALARKRPDTIKELGLVGDAISYVGPLGARRTIKLHLADDELVVNTEHHGVPLAVPVWSKTAAGG